MGIKLVIEVLDHYHGPDARKLWLLAWAEKANDKTRAGWPAREVLAHRTGRSAVRVSNVATELVTEGVLKRDGGGNRSGPARFILLPLAEAEKGSELANPTAEVKGSELANPKPGVKGSESKRKGSESGRKGSASKPPPAETGSLPLIPSIDHPSEEPTVGADAPTAQTIIASFIDWVRGSGGDLTKQTIGRLAKQIGDLLAQGKPDRHIRTGLANWYFADQNPATLDSFVNSAMNAEARGRAAQNGHSRASPGKPAAIKQNNYTDEDYHSGW